MEAAESEATASPSVHCDGGGGASGHPRVFLRIGDGDSVECPYCGKRFVLDARRSDK